MTYQLLTNLDGTTSLVRTNADGSQTWIPQDSENSDYKEYLLTPVAPTPLPTAQQDEITAAAAQVTAVANAKAAVVNALTSLAPAQTQAQNDLSTLKTSTSANAPILTNIITNTLILAEAVSNLLIVLGVTP